MRYQLVKIVDVDGRYWHNVQPGAPPISDEERIESARASAGTRGDGVYALIRRNWSIEDRRQRQGQVEPAEILDVFEIDMKPTVRDL